MDGTTIYTIIFILFVALILGTFGYLTDWTFKPSKLATSRDLGCFNPSDDLFDKYPNALLFKANYERTECVPDMCKAGFELSENKECILTLPMYVNCYTFVPDGISLKPEDLFFLRDGITPMDITDTKKTILFEQLKSGDKKTISKNLLESAYGFISASKSGTPAKKISDFEFIAVKKDDIIVTNQKPVDNYLYMSIISGFCQDDPEDIKSYDEYYMLYSLPRYKKSDSYDQILQSIYQEKDRGLTGYRLKDTGSEYPLTTLKCNTGSDNVINSKSGLVSLDVCKKKCDDNEDCRSFTYYFQPEHIPMEGAEDPTYYLNWDRVTNIFGDVVYYLSENCILHNDPANQPEVNPFANCYIKN